MRAHLQGIDHVVIAVTDLDQAQHDYQRLGFALTPRGLHTMGSQNHCAMFPGDYFELLSVPADHSVTRYYSDFLRHGDGLAALALKTGDAAGFHQELIADGVACDAPVDFSRPVSLSGGVRDAAFRIAQVHVAATPGGRIFACQHFTRDVVWRPEYLSHPNGALALQRISLLVDPVHLAETAACYEQLFDRSGERRPDTCREIATGNTPIRLLTPANYAVEYDAEGHSTRSLPYFAALHFRVASVSRTRQVLERNMVLYQARTDGSIVVSTELAHGLVIVFSQASL